MSTDAPAGAPPATGSAPAPAPSAPSAPAPAPVHAPAAPAPASVPQQYQQARSSQFVQYPNAYGHQFQPYQQYGMVPVGAAAANAPPRWSTLQSQIPPGAQVIEPPRIVESKRSAMFKMGLHSIGFIFGLVVLALGITFANDYDMGIIMVIMNSVLAAMIILWSGTELICRGCRNLKRGIHPGAHVGVTLIIWLAAAVVGGFATAITVSAVYYDGYWGSYYCSSSYDGYGYASYDDCDEPTGRNAILVASTVFTWLELIIYFVIFVLACIDTSRHNAAKSRPIMLVPQGAWAPETGAVPMPPPGAYHPAAVPHMATVPRQSMMPPHQQQQRDSQPPHVASGALPAQTNEKGEASGSQAGVREFYTPGTAN